ncbi:PIN domain-containing protein [Actinomadura alba]|uniref:DUF4935 domain-containing protein n=1 Tax=Actinomadura alba TaxID=406431 RepID=A0ABR7M2R5_9ACTN|nr:PIN domain-containing protein [Actinomadura alba]MBC6471398.1 DUF4935 domain-containing protein [Actinomadura alba]
MTDTPAPSEQQSDLAGLRERFPGFYKDDLQDFVTNGLVTFDTNALFDVYRFNQRARTEFLAALRLLEDRLWISNRVGQELLENRSTVIKDAARATNELDTDLSKHFDEAVGIVRKFGKRRGFSESQVNRLVERLRSSQASIVQQADRWIQFDLKGDEPPHRDPILQNLEEVIGSKVGPLLSDTKAAEQEALSRFDREMPPGYQDWRKEKQRAVGDCLIWFQLMEEAARRKVPILMVTNERKADWVVKNKDDEIIAPRPELVLEMKETTGLSFQLINIQDFLIYAKKHLGATVSDTTVQQAKSPNRNFSNDELKLRRMIKAEGGIATVRASSTDNGEVFLEVKSFDGNLLIVRPGQLELETLNFLKAIQDIDPAKLKDSRRRRIDQ